MTSAARERRGDAPVNLLQKRRDLSVISRWQYATLRRSGQGMRDLCSDALLDCSENCVIRRTGAEFCADEVSLRLKRVLAVRGVYLRSTHGLSRYCSQSGPVLYSFYRQVVANVMATTKLVTTATYLWSYRTRSGQIGTDSLSIVSHPS